MRLLLVYGGLVFVGLLISYGAGRVAETWSQPVSLMVFLGCFFVTLWLGWQLAVKITDVPSLRDE
jgi:hypothetical protein